MGPSFGLGLGDGAVDRVGVGHIAFDHGERLVDRLAAARGDRDSVAVGCKPEGGGHADSSVASRDQNGSGHHSNTAVPQVMPPPKPVMQTLAPGRSTPSD